MPRPAPFSACTTPAFWDDPHISARMLEQHLDPVSDRAPRPHAQIDRSVTWLVELMALTPGQRVLDLGCGPGLYATRLARGGLEVVGVDVSTRSVAHLRAVTAREDLPIQVVHGSYLEADLAPDGGLHDAAIMIFEDYSALSPGHRGRLLGRIRDALGPGGQLVFDVTSAAAFPRFADARREGPDLMDGFWAPRPYHGVHETFTYPELRLVLDRFTITAGGTQRVFWNWMHCLSVEPVAGELEAAGLRMVGVYGDVTGAPFDPASPVFAVHARRD